MYKPPMLDKNMLVTKLLKLYPKEKNILVEGDFSIPFKMIGSIERKIVNGVIQHVGIVSIYGHMLWDYDVTNIHELNIYVALEHILRNHYED